MSKPSMFKQYLHKALNLFYPRNACCVCCGSDKIMISQSICSDCLSNIATAPPPREDIPLIASLTAAFEYKEPIRSLIHQFKYSNKQYLARFFAESIIQYIPTCDIIFPIPLHPIREKERGYSQTNLICMELARLTRQPIQYNILMRTRHTPSQTTLSAQDRKLNLYEAFKAFPIPSPIQSVCLIDDVATTGTTLQESAKALHDIGIQTVYACVIAY